MERATAVETLAAEHSVGNKWPIRRRAAHVAQDTPAISEAVKTLSRRGRAPTDGDYKMLQTLGRVPIRYPLTANKFIKEAMRDTVRVHADTDTPRSLCFDKAQRGHCLGLTWCQTSKQSSVNDSS